MNVPFLGQHHRCPNRFSPATITKHHTSVNNIILLHQHCRNSERFHFTTKKCTVHIFKPLYCESCNPHLLSLYHFVPAGAIYAVGSEIDIGGRAIFTSNGAVDWGGEEVSVTATVWEVIYTAASCQW